MKHEGRTNRDRAVYDASFSRNLGILTAEEQKRLSEATVLVVGTGGIGGNCVSILARMGVGGFHLVDPDSFELANINRQFGAKVSTQGRYKVDVISEEISDINPSVRIKSWKEPFSEANADAAFEGVDICIDAIDFYSIADHLLFHRIARRKGRFIVMGSPVGFSACLQVFDPEGMSLEEYCGIADTMDPVEQQLRYACGIVPRLAHISYYDVSKQNTNTDFLRGKGPSLASACSLAASFVAGEIVTILLNRRKPRVIPHTLQHDPYTFRNEAIYVDGGMSAYDPSEVIDGIEDKSSMVVNIFDHFYRKVHAATLDLRDGGSLCYRIEGKGKPVLLLSPVGADTSFWARQGPFLAQDLQIITLDNRGIGRSSSLPEGATTVDMAQDVIQLIEHLELSEVAVVGCALGGLIGLQMALLRPDLISGLSVCSAYAAADETIMTITKSWRQLARQSGMDAVFDASLDKVFAPEYRRNNNDELYKLKTFYRVNQQHPEEFCKQTRAANLFEPVVPLSEIACPVQVVHGDADSLVAPSLGQELHEVIPGSELILVPGGGHFLNWERSGEYNAHIGDFLAAIGCRS